MPPYGVATPSRLAKMVNVASGPPTSSDALKEVDESDLTEDPGGKPAITGWVERALAATALLAVVASAWLVLVASGRGIDVTDQSLYLLMVDNPLASIRSASGFHHILSPAFELVGESIVNWRRFRAVLDIGVDIVLALSVIRFIKFHRPESAIVTSPLRRALVGTGIVTFGFMTWSGAPNGFGYNELGGILNTLLMASLLNLLVEKNSSAKSHLLSGFSGALMALLVVTRWTAGPIALAVLIVFALHRHRKQAVIAALSGSIGFAVMAAAVHLFIIDLGTLIQGTVDGTTDVSQGVHGRSRIISEYITSALNAVATMGFFLIPAVLAYAPVHLSKQGQLPGRAVPVLSITLSGASLVAFHLAFSGDSKVTLINGWAGAVVLLLVVLLVTCARAVWNERGRTEALQAVAVPALFLGVSFWLQVGTNNQILWSAVHSAALWAAAIAILLHVAPPLRVAPFAIGAIGIAGAMIPVFLFTSLTVEPYRITGDQNIAVEQGPFSGLQVDERTHRFLTDLNGLRDELGPEPTVLSFWTRPAVNYALGGQGIGFPWYAPDAPNTAASSIEGACVDDGFVPPGEVVVVTSSDLSQFDNIERAMQACGINFPTGFQLTSSLVAPSGIDLDVYVARS